MIFHIYVSLPESIFIDDIGISISGGAPSSLDGLSRGKSENNMDENWE